MKRSATIFMILILFLASCSAGKIDENPSTKPILDVQPVSFKILSIPLLVEKIPDENKIEAINEILEKKYT